MRESPAVDRAVHAQLVATIGADFVTELTDTFVTDARQLLETLRRAFDAGDRDAFRRAAHSLKSNGDTLGATALAAQARALKAMARAGTIDDAGDRFEPLARVRARDGRAGRTPPMTASHNAHTGRLLVVDDNRVNRLLLSRAREQLGHTVTFAEYGREALEVLRRQLIALVLLDIEMPEMDGYQVLEALGADPRLRDVPVVMLSSVDEGRQHRALHRDER